MAENITNNLMIVVELPIKHKQLLSNIRHWDNLKVASDSKSIWVKDFTQVQLESTELKSIPFAQLYECIDNLLFPKGSLLPIAKMPSFLWTPIEKALPIELIGINHNFFGIHQHHPIQLIASHEEQKSTVLLVNKMLANDYINAASAVRLQPISWTFINNENALFFGEPLLPLNGNAFWQRENFIFPIGYNLEFPIFFDVIQKKISKTDFVWWQSLTQYTLLPKHCIKPLSIASWRKTIKPE